MDVSENTLPLKSQSINNFSGIDISQSVDWQCPSLSPRFLLVECFILVLGLLIDKSKVSNFIIFRGL